MRDRNKYTLASIKQQTEGEPFLIDDIHNGLLDMMKSFHDFCEVKHLQYYLAGGTLLGAIRHNGFIPWDDDVDIYMMRDDYEKLVKHHSISDRYEIVTSSNTHGYYHPYPYCNITDNTTIQVEYQSRYMSGKGLFIDIFPVDGIPNNWFKRTIFYLKIYRLRYLKGIPLNNIKKVRNFKDLCFNAAIIILKPINEMKVVKKIENLAKGNSLQECDDCEQVVIPSKLHCPKHYYDDPILHRFEDAEFFIPSQYDDILKRQYADYMILPEAKDRVCQHGVEVYRRKHID